MNFYGLTLEELTTILHENGHKPYAAKQVFDWVYKKGQCDFKLMSNISKPLRAFLDEHYHFGRLTINTEQTAKDQTTKYLFELSDGEFIETVLMHHDYGKSICISTQVGCLMGCAFCASGLDQKVRDLTAAEMTMQILEIEAREHVRISHVVVMGAGEPFDNYDNVMRFIDIINNPYGLEIGARHITVSTCGIIPGIERFSLAAKQVNLAISLHAPNDEIRDKLMKINRTYPLKQLIQSLKKYTEKTSRRVTLEYLLIKDVNDTLAHADQLSDLLRGLNCYVNLIRYNPVSTLPYEPSDKITTKAFLDRLLKRSIQATKRREMGLDIDAACGQLRSRKM